MKKRYLLWRLRRLERTLARVEAERRSYKYGTWEDFSRYFDATRLERRIRSLKEKL